MHRPCPRASAQGRRWMDLPVSPSDIGGGLSKQGLYYVVGVLCVVIAWLTYKLLDVQQSRITDRDKFQERLEALAREGHAVVAENGKSFWAVQRELMQFAPKRPPKAPP